MRNFSKLAPKLALTAALVLALPMASLAQTASYKIRPGDSLQLDVLEDSTLNRTLLVLPDGTIAVPQGGVVKASGLTLPQVQAAVTDALAASFAAPPTVNLAVGSLGTPTATATAAVAGIYVMGEVAKPGRVDVPPGTTMLQFLAEAGGLTPFAATKRIQLRRVDAAGIEQVYLFNYAAVMAGQAAAAMVLKKGDVIVVPQRRLFE